MPRRHVYQGTQESMAERYGCVTVHGEGRCQREGEKFGDKMRGERERERERITYQVLHASSCFL